MPFQVDVQIRWLIRRDMPEVLVIDNEGYAQPWADNDFLDVLRKRNCIGMIAERDHQVVGFMIYKLEKDRIEILRFAVDAGWRRMKIGTQMISRLVDKLSQQRRLIIEAVVREGADHAHSFLKSMEFKAERVIRGGAGAEDEYIFKYRLNDQANAVETKARAYVPVNRISAYYEGTEDASA